MRRLNVFPISGILIIILFSIGNNSSLVDVQFAIKKETIG
jgi:hypothetical protein